MKPVGELNRRPVPGLYWRLLGGDGDGREWRALCGLGFLAHGVQGTDSGRHGPWRDDRVTRGGIDLATRPRLESYPSSQRRVSVFPRDVHLYR
jgi:hypothetical protein